MFETVIVPLDGSELAEAAIEPAREIAEKFGSTLLRVRGGVAVTDLGPMRAARREALLGLGLEDRRFGWPLEMVLRAAAEGWRIEEVPVRYRPRVGRSKVTGTVRGTVRTARDMTRVAATVGVVR